MKFWIFLLCTIVIAILSIWGCLVIIDVPEPVTAGVFDNAIVDISQVY